MARLTILGALFAAALLSPASAGQASLNMLPGDAFWKPTGCIAPTPPTVLLIASEFDYQLVVVQYNSYINDLKDYSECIAKEGERDITAFSDLVVRRVKKIREELAAEAEQLRNDIETLRPRRR